MIVSNHGGRGVDCTLASIEALPEVVEAVAGRATVLLDSGVRRGTDVLKALALGAQAVLIGPCFGGWLWTARLACAGSSRFCATRSTPLSPNSVVQAWRAWIAA